METETIDWASADLTDAWVLLDGIQILRKDILETDEFDRMLKGVMTKKLGEDGFEGPYYFTDKDTRVVYGLNLPMMALVGGALRQDHDA